MLPNRVFDLHAHSTFSDGDLSPEELVARAHRAGVTVLALTDHDAVGGLPQARVAAEAVGMQLVAGVELSSRWSNMDIHIVGLGVDDTDPSFLARLATQSERRYERSERIQQRLSKLGMGDILAAVKAQVGEKPPGRPDFAQAMIQAGHCRSVDEAFRKYLGQGKPAYIAMEWPALPEAVQWILDAGGQAVLAHPGRYKLTRTKLSLLIADFKQAGGAAIEVVTSSQEPTKTNQLADLAEKYGLLASVGSDYHGPKMPWVEIGRYAALPTRCKPVWQDWVLF